MNAATHVNSMSPVQRIARVMALHARDRGTWFVLPAVTLGATFIIGWFIVLARYLLLGGVGDAYTGALAALLIMLAVGGIGSIGSTYPLAVGFGTLRRDYVVGTLALASAVSAAWAIVVGLLSLVEADVFRNWGIGYHFFYLPFFSDGSPLRRFCWTPGALCAQADPTYARGGVSVAQFWVYFIVLLFMCLLGLFVGSVYQRFGRIGEYILIGAAFLLLSVFVLLSTYLSWWGAIFQWLAQQTAATLGLWLVPWIVLFALASYALLRKATV